MKSLFALSILFATAGAAAQTPPQVYPSCDLAAQHAARGTIGGRIRDTGEAHISVRANILQADIGRARKARRLTQPQADTLWTRVEAIRADTDAFTRRQGFLSAAERASYDRNLDAVAGEICR